MDFGQFATIAALLSGGRNVGAMFPIDDATDIRNGARYIPGDVTMARRAGKRVLFDAEKHEWTLPDGSKAR
mgnify:CR=1 FL=1